jgi:hypothetical protein
MSTPNQQLTNALNALQQSMGPAYSSRFNAFNDVILSSPATIQGKSGGTILNS